MLPDSCTELTDSCTYNTGAVVHAKPPVPYQHLTDSTTATLYVTNTLPSSLYFPHNGSPTYHFHIIFCLLAIVISSLCSSTCHLSHMIICLFLCSYKFLLFSLCIISACLFTSVMSYLSYALPSFHAYTFATQLLFNPSSSIYPLCESSAFSPLHSYI